MRRSVRSWSLNQLNRTAATHASSLVRAGKVDSSAAWSFGASDENALLGDPPDWTRYALWHLGQDSSAAEKTKARYKYPYGKNGKVFRSAVRAIRSRAAKQGDDAIGSAAKSLLDAMDAKAAA